MLPVTHLPNVAWAADLYERRRRTLTTETHEPVSCPSARTAGPVHRPATGLLARDLPRWTRRRDSAGRTRRFNTFAAASICFSTTTLDARNQHLAADDRGRRSRLALRAEIGRTAGSLAAACGRHYA